MKIVNIYTSDERITPTFKFTSDNSKEEIINEIFKCKIYARQFDNKCIAINTEKILFVEIIEEDKK